jgi:hypothetical protein
MIEISHLQLHRQFIDDPCSDFKRIVIDDFQGHFILVAIAQAILDNPLPGYRLPGSEQNNIIKDCHHNQTYEGELGRYQQGTKEIRKNEKNYYGNP